MQGRATILAPLAFSAVAICLAVALFQLDRENSRQEGRDNLAPTPQTAPLQVEMMTNKGLGYEIRVDKSVEFEDLAKLIELLFTKFDEIKRLISQAELLRAQLYPAHHWSEEYHRFSESPLRWDQRIQMEFDGPYCWLPHHRQPKSAPMY